MTEKEEVKPFDMNRLKQRNEIAAKKLSKLIDAELATLTADDVGVDAMREAFGRFQRETLAATGWDNERFREQCHAEAGGLLDYAEKRGDERMKAKAWISTAVQVYYFYGDASWRPKRGPKSKKSAA